MNTLIQNMKMSLDDKFMQNTRRFKQIHFKYVASPQHEVCSFKMINVVKNLDIFVRKFMSFSRVD